MTTVRPQVPKPHFLSLMYANVHAERLLTPLLRWADTYMLVDVFIPGKIFVNDSSFIPLVSLSQSLAYKGKSQFSAHSYVAAAAICNYF